MHLELLLPIYHKEDIWLIEILLPITTIQEHMVAVILGKYSASYHWKNWENKNYYTEEATGQIKDKTGQRVGYDPSTGKVQSARGR